jgi:hypothetical protein
VTILRIYQKEDSYKNFRRNILGSCIDSKFFSRNDSIDNKNDIHNSFDYGFLMALAKIKYELSLLEHQFKKNEIDAEAYFKYLNKLLHERLEITYGKNQDPRRGVKLEKMVLQNENRISDDHE